MDDVDEDHYLHVTHIQSVLNQGMPRRNAPQRRQQSQDGINDNKFVVNRNICIVVSVLTVSMVLNAVIGTYLLLRANTSEHQTYETSKLKVPHEARDDLSACMCVLCTSLGMPSEFVRSSHARDVIIINIADGKHLCCLKYSQYLQKLIHVFSAQFQTGGGSTVNVHGGPLESSQTLTNSAHLYLKSSALKDNRLVWTTEFGYGSAYIGPGIAVLETMINIKEGGRYFLYSFITLKSFHFSDTNPTIIHTVSRYNPKLARLGDQLLLFGKISLARQGEKFRSSYLAAGVVLRAGDELWVDVEPLSSVYAYSPANYFGLYRID